MRAAHVLWGQASQMASLQNPRPPSRSKQSTGQRVAAPGLHAQPSRIRQQQPGLDLGERVLLRLHHQHPHKHRRCHIETLRMCSRPRCISLAAPFMDSQSMLTIQAQSCKQTHCPMLRSNQQPPLLQLIRPGHNHPSYSGTLLHGHFLKTASKPHRVDRVGAAQVQRGEHGGEGEPDDQVGRPIQARAQRGRGALDLVGQHLGEVDPGDGPAAGREAQHEGHHQRE